jgi:hypothetical protein
MPAQEAKGAVVLYVLPRGPSKGQQRPALVVEHLHSDLRDPCDLWVLPNPKTDGDWYQYPAFVAAAFYDAGKSLGTWS